MKYTSSLFHINARNKTSDITHRYASYCTTIENIRPCYMTRRTCCVTIIRQQKMSQCSQSKCLGKVSLLRFQMQSHNMAVQCFLCKALAGSVRTPSLYPCLYKVGDLQNQYWYMFTIRTEQTSRKMYRSIHSFISLMFSNSTPVDRASRWLATN